MGQPVPVGQQQVGERLRLAEIRATALTVDEVLEAVAGPRAGGLAVFVGTVRDHDGSRPVRQLAYSAHPSAERVLHQVADRALSDPQVLAGAVLHRVGPLQVGDVAIVAAVACAHRVDAFAVCRRLVDDVKSQVPIWKHQVFADGTEEWVGAAT
ncbi:MAG: molybdenum cofactor biosynthesis protein MoaE [Actinomycetes bacterium]